MSFVFYVAADRAIAMVEQVNSAKTETEHHDARMKLLGYKARCEEMGQSWPAVELDFHFEDGDRPTCCGEYLDWAPTKPQQEQQS